MELKVIFYERRGSDEIYRCPENHKLYLRRAAYQRGYVSWFTTTDHGCEADCHIKAGVTMIVADVLGKEVFRETLEKDEANYGTHVKQVYPFLYDAIKNWGIDYAKQHNLISHEEWRKWLLSKKNDNSYDDNWLYTGRDCLQDSFCEAKNFMGNTYILISKEIYHKASGLSWIEFLVENDNTKVEYICGYILKEENLNA